MRLTLIALIGMAVVGGGGTILYRSGLAGAEAGGIPESMLFAVQRGKLVVTITENGTLLAKNSEKIVFQGNRGGKITFLVEEGKTVEPDEVLCRMETTELEKQIQQLELDINKTQADLDTAKTELDIQKSENIANIEKARIAVTKAQNELEKYRDGDAPKERRTLEVAIKEAETKHSRAKKKYEDSLVLREQDYISKSQLEQDEIEFERAEIELTSAQRNLELFEKYTFPMTMTDKQTALSDAQRDFENANKRAKSTLRQKEVAVESQESRLNTLNKSLEESKEELDKCTVKAPSPGIVLYGDPSQRWYRNYLKLGGEVWGGLTLFTIPDLRLMQVQLRVHEADINKLKVDQPATVTMDTYPGLVLKGQVTKIASIAESNNDFGMDDEVKKFTVEVTLEPREDLKLKPGISAKTEIFVEERPDVLFVPIQCVFLEQGKHYCHVLRDGGEPVRVEVQPDVSNDKFIQIAAGLAEGDRVLLYNPTLLAGAAQPVEEQAATPPAQPAAGGPPAGP